MQFGRPQGDHLFLVGYPHVEGLVRTANLDPAT